MSAGVIAAVSCAALTNLVARGEPFQFTVSPWAKPVPFTVSVKSPGPQNGVLFKPVVDAESDVTVGRMIENGSALEVPPPQFTPGPGVHWLGGKGGLKTVTWAVPTAAIFAAGTAAVSCAGADWVAGP